MNSKPLELAKKLLALAQKGVGGEKINAEVLLKKHLARHNLSLEDIEEEIKIEHWKNITKKDNVFFNQIIANVLGNTATYRLYTDKNSHRQIGIECTHAEWVEINAKYDFYKKALKKEYESFYFAFIIANDLFPKETKEDSGKKKEEDLTPEELAEYNKALHLSKAIDKSNFRKQIQWNHSPNN